MAEKIGGIEFAWIRHKWRPIHSKRKRWKSAPGLCIAAFGIDKVAHKLVKLLHAGNLWDIYFILVETRTEEPYTGLSLSKFSMTISRCRGMCHSKDLFHKMEHASGKTADQFVCQLHQNAAICAFSETSEEIWDQMIDGCWDIALWKKFLEETAVIEWKSHCTHMRL